MESDTPMSKKNEDEENNFDRVLLVTQTIVMSLFGFPSQGFMEMKCEDMLNRSVKILTRYGKELAEYRAGLPQGSPLSVLIANLVMWLKHKTMRRKIDCTEQREDHYIFKKWDMAHELKNHLIRSTEGYSDDNESFHSDPSAEQLCKYTLDSITLTGYFSIVTKLGRCGSKSVVEFWNMDPRDAAYIKNFDFSSFAWSFEYDGPIKETMSIMAHFRQREHEWHNLSEENRTAIKHFRSQHRYLKHLGISTRTDRPESAATGRDKCVKVINRVNQMYVKAVDDKTLAIIINQLVISCAQYAVLEANMTAEDLMKIDRAIIAKVRQGFKITAKDMKEWIFLPHEDFGMNIRSFQLTDLEATVRELECGLNGEESHCESMRARLQAWADRVRGKKYVKWINFERDGIIESNIRKAATHGVYLRDKRYQLCNVLVDKIHQYLRDNRGQSMQKRATGPLGTIDYKHSTTGGALGKGDRGLLKFSTHSPEFTKLRKFMEQKHSVDDSTEWRWSSSWHSKNGIPKQFYGLNAFELGDCAQEALDQIRSDTINFFLFYEWRGEKASGIAKGPVTDILEWTRTLTKWSHPNTRTSDCKVTYDVATFEAAIYNKMVDEQRIGNRLWPSIEEIAQVDEFLDLTGTIRRTRQSQRRAQSRDEEILQYFEDKNCPFFSGSDGGHLTVENNNVNRGASAAVLCAPYMEEGEIFDDILDCWFERDIVIFVIRVSLLPAHIGTVSVSSVQTEASGFCNLGTMLYNNPPQLLILDSNATVVNARNLRDNPNIPARRRVRGSGVAAGKGYCARMRRIFEA